LIGFEYTKGGVTTDYYYVKNLQGDIIGILDKDGNSVVEYSYDAWGKLQSVTGSLASTVGQDNAFRYRGYYYDVETGFYYLQSRYYDAGTCRFINADDTRILGLAGGTILGANLFAYGVNNPVMNSDPKGYYAINLNTVLVGVLLDFFITIAFPYIFTAHKVTRLAKWAKGSKWFGGIYEKAIKLLSKNIYNAMDRIMYNISGRAANAATRSFTLKKIENWVGNILNFSIGYGIAWIIDCIDSDGKSGYIRF